jgi:hypothetical protein
MFDIDLLEEVDIRDTESDDPLYAHYAEKAKVTEGYIMGTPVIALCGKVFIPHRDPLKLPICQECHDIINGLFLETE